MLRRIIVYKYVKNEDGKYEKVEDGEANFHAFGCSYEGLIDGVGNFSTAIIERKNGTVENVSVEMIKFIK